MIITIADVTRRSVGPIIATHCATVYAHIRAEGWSPYINSSNRLMVAGMVKAAKTKREGIFQIKISTRIRMPYAYHKIEGVALSSDGDEFEEVVGR